MWQKEAHMNAQLFYCRPTNAALQSWNYVHLLESKNVEHINMLNYHGNFGKFDFFGFAPLKDCVLHIKRGSPLHWHISVRLRQFGKTWRF